MKIRIIKRIGKTLDGVKIGEYIQDKEYDIQEDLAKIFIESGIAEEIRIPVIQIAETPVYLEVKSSDVKTVSEPVSQAKKK